MAFNMTDFRWGTLDTLCFNKESQDSALSTLTIRLAGLTQITNQLHTFNDMCNYESLVSAEMSIAKELADWFRINNVVEHIFGPNLHADIIKQCRVALNFLAAEG